MQFFRDMKQDVHTTYYFFPTVYVNSLNHFLEESKITDWEILSKKQALTQLPEDFVIPEVRLTPTAPRIEKRISCFVSHYDIQDVKREYWRLVFSQEWLDWNNDVARRALEDYERLNGKIE